MNFANTRRLLILWIGAFVGAFFLHIVLGAQFYFRSPGVKNDTFSSTIMLTFASETVYPDVDIDLPNIDTDLSNVITEPQILQPDLPAQEAKILESVDEIQSEESQHAIEKDDFSLLKPLEESPPPKVEHKALVKKPIPVLKSVVKHSTVKTVRSSTTSQAGSPAELEDALLMEWLAQIQAQLERQKKYVVGQRTSRTKGTVKLEFRVHEQGEIFSSRIVVSAGDPELDRLAMAVLQRVGFFPPPPPSKVHKIIRVSLIFS
ncbi:energy transducer TonB family protein [Bartonella quintana]|uniref:energy transducer TonB family protein n=1 Tax=Bartonella quintana TaxID=803 RepID=UPI00027FCD1E|nr:TonB family protein [Bartonella quintana]AFR26138.1 tonB protein [Bartonella quintana RM-11]